MFTKIKNILFIFLISVIVFCIATLLTIKNETPIDGNDTYGFPFTFFTEYGGKRVDYNGLVSYFQIEYLVVDYIIIVIIVFLLASAWSWFKS
jgi:hypothetical protein